MFISTFSPLASQECNISQPDSDSMCPLEPQVHFQHKDESMVKISFTSGYFCGVKDIWNMFVWKKGYIGELIPVKQE